MGLVTTGRPVTPVLRIAVLVLADTVETPPATMARTAVHVLEIVAHVLMDTVEMGHATMGKTVTHVHLTVDHVLHQNIVVMVSATMAKCATSALIVGCALHLPNIVGMAFVTTVKHVIHVPIVVLVL
jgi:hypothetical protein